MGETYIFIRLHERIIKPEDIDVALILIEVLKLGGQEEVMCLPDLLGVSCNHITSRKT